MKRSLQNLRRSCAAEQGRASIRNHVHRCARRSTVAEDAPAKPRSEAALFQEFSGGRESAAVGSAGDRNPIPARHSSRSESAEVYIAGNHIAAALGLRRTRYHAGRRKRSVESAGGQWQSEFATLHRLSRCGFRTWASRTRMPLTRTTSCWAHRNSRCA